MFYESIASSTHKRSTDWPKTNNADTDLCETMFSGTMFTGLSFLQREGKAL